MKNDDWQQLRLDYSQICLQAEKEKPPGLASLLKGVLEAIDSGDRSVIDRASASVQGNLPPWWIDRYHGAVLFDLGYTEDGLGILARACAHDPTTDSLQYLAPNLCRAKKYNDALKTYRHLRQRCPDDPLAILGEAAVLTRLGRIEEALVCYESTEHVLAADANYWYDYASVLVAVRRYDDAVSAYIQSMGSGYKDELAVWCGIAYCYAMKGDRHKTREWANKVRKSDPDNAYITQLCKDVFGTEKRETEGGSRS